MRTLFMCLLVGVVEGYSMPAGGQHDIFPLAKGLRFTYAYNSSDIQTVMLVPAEGSVDSGIVEYVVRDSTDVNDTLRIWTVGQRHTFSLYTYSYGQTTLVGSFSDTLNINVVETLSAQHTIEANGMLWAFPLGGDTVMVPISRYCDSSSPMVNCTWLGRDNSTDCACGVDSAWFDEGKGLVMRKTTTWSGCGNEHDVTSTEYNIIDSSTTSVASSPALPASPVLIGSYPNPFNPATTIWVGTRNAGVVVLRVYDVLGRVVATLEDGRVEAGVHAYRFSAEGLASGIYVCRAEVGSTSVSHRIVYLR